MQRIPNICDKRTFYYCKILQNNEANALNGMITGIVDKKHLKKLFNAKLETGKIEQVKSVRRWCDT